MGEIGGKKKMSRKYFNRVSKARYVKKYASCRDFDVVAFFCRLPGHRGGTHRCKTSVRPPLAYYKRDDGGDNEPYGGLVPCRRRC